MSRSQADNFLIWSLRLTAGVAGAVLALILLFVLLEASPLLARVGPVGFFTDEAWRPTQGLYNLAPMLVGTLVVTLGAVLIAGPLGILSAMFCNDYAPPRLARVYRGMIELLAGVPSVVYGFWGLVVLVPLIARVRPPGASLLAGVLILGLMILPTVALLADASIAAVPSDYRRAAWALGLSRWAVLSRVVLPAARRGISTGLFLATARAIGETMAVLMVCGNVIRVPASVFDPVRTLTANIALEMAYAMGDHRSALFVSGLVLMLMVVALVMATQWIGGGHARD